MNTLLQQMRYAPEERMMGELFERFSLEPILASFEAEGLPDFRQQMLATRLKLSRSLSPRLFALLDEVRGTLGFEPPIDLFISADADINAYAIHTVDETPHIIGLTSSLVERLGDAELRFVLGHEIGHLAFRHYRAKLLTPAFGDTEMPTLLKRRLASWSRLAELSADRAGLAASGSDLQPVVSAFFKIESGLGPEHVRFDIRAFLEQLDELQAGDRDAMLSHFSHPLTPIRVRALQLFKEAQGADDGTAAVDARVESLVTLMETGSSTPLEAHARDFLLAAGVLIAHADTAGIGDEENQVLVDMLLPLLPDPEVAIEGLGSAEEALKLMQTSAEWLKANAGEERFFIFRLLTKIATADGALKAEEEPVMKLVAGLLDIPETARRKMLHEGLTANLQAKRSTGGASPGTFSLKNLGKS